MHLKGEGSFKSRDLIISYSIPGPKAELFSLECFLFLEPLCQFYRHYQWNRNLLLLWQVNYHQYWQIQSQLLLYELHWYSLLLQLPATGFSLQVHRKFLIVCPDLFKGHWVWQDVLLQSQIWQFLWIFPFSLLKFSSDCLLWSWLAEQKHYQMWLVGEWW